MRNLTIVFALALASVSHAVDPRWVANLDVAMKQAAKTKRLVLLDVFDPTAPGGQAFERLAYHDPRVVKALGTVVPVRVMAKKNGRALAKKYRIDSFPTALVLNPTGRVVWRIAGPTPPLTYVRWLDKAKALAARMSGQRPGSVEDFASKAISAAAANDIEGALAALKSAEALKDPQGSDKLADAYNMLGDSYQITNQLDRAIPSFDKASVAKDGMTRAYALISLGSCYLIKGESAKGRPYLEKVVKMGPAAGEWVASARGMLAPPRQRAAVN